MSQLPFCHTSLSATPTPHPCPLLQPDKFFSFLDLLWLLAKKYCWSQALAMEEEGCRGWKVLTSFLSDQYHVVLDPCGEGSANWPTGQGLPAARGSPPSPCFYKQSFIGTQLHLVVTLHCRRAQWFVQPAD